MPPINPLSLSARRWEFLSDPDRYVAATARSERKLVVESTRRQFLTAHDILSRLNGSFGKSAQRGLLLADDVGLGKTPIAALIAWVVASAGDGRSVRILAPNNVMMRRWEEELQAHVEPLQRCASHLDVRRTRVKVGKVGNLRAGSIQVAKHSYAASKQPLKCSLLIIDEAHRAKGDKTEFRAALKKQRKHAERVLILTATPFSIRLEELVGLLDLIDAPATVKSQVRTFSRALDDLYFGNTARSAEAVAGRLAAKAAAALEEIARPPARAAQVRGACRLADARAACDGGRRRADSTDGPRATNCWSNGSGAEDDQRSAISRRMAPLRFGGATAHEGSGPSPAAHQGRYPIAFGSDQTAARTRDNPFQNLRRRRAREAHRGRGAKGRPVLPPSCDRAGTRRVSAFNAS